MLLEVVLRLDHASQCQNQVQLLFIFVFNQGRVSVTHRLLGIAQNLDSFLDALDLLLHVGSVASALLLAWQSCKEILQFFKVELELVWRNLVDSLQLEDWGQVLGRTRSHKLITAQCKVDRIDISLNRFDFRLDQGANITHIFLLWHFLKLKPVLFLHLLAQDSFRLKSDRSNKSYHNRINEFSEWRRTSFLEINLEAFNFLFNLCMQFGYSLQTVLTSINNVDTGAFLLISELDSGILILER